MGESFSVTSPEVASTLLQAGLWAVTGKKFAIQAAGLPVSGNLDQFREALMQRAIREKMIPMLAEFTRTNDLGLGSVPDHLSEVFRLISREQYVHLQPVLADLAERGLPVVLIKGADLDLAIYQKKFPRVMGDIDILIRPPDRPAVVEAFRRHGFIQGTLNKSLLSLEPLTDADREQEEEGSIELVEFSKLVSVPELLPFRGLIDRWISYWRMSALGDTYYLVVGYDVHIHLSLDFDLRDVWTDFRAIEFPGVGQCLAQSYTDLAWYLAVRFYHELHLNNAFVMRSFLDVLLVVSCHHATFDWKRIAQMAGKYKLHPALYYTFWHVNEVLGDVVPHQLMDQLCPLSVDVDRAHDWGDFMPRILGDIQVLPVLAKVKAS